MTYRAAVDTGTFCECPIRSSHYTDRDIFGKWDACSDCRLPIDGTYKEQQEDSKLVNF